MEPFLRRHRRPVEGGHVEASAEQATGSGLNGALRQPCKSEGFYIPLGVYDALDSTVPDTERPCDLPHTLAFAP